LSRYIWNKNKPREFSGFILLVAVTFFSNFFFFLGFHTHL
jgi:hypothetical protein